MNRTMNHRKNAYTLPISLNGPSIMYKKWWTELIQQSAMRCFTTNNETHVKHGGFDWFTAPNIGSSLFWLPKVEGTWFTLMPTRDMRKDYVLFWT